MSLIFLGRKAKRRSIKFLDILDREGDTILRMKNMITEGREKTDKERETEKDSITFNCTIFAKFQKNLVSLDC